MQLARLHHHLPMGCTTTWLRLHLATAWLIFLLACLLAYFLACLLVAVPLLVGLLIGLVALLLLVGLVVGLVLCLGAWLLHVRLVGACLDFLFAWLVGGWVGWWAVHSAAAVVAGSYLLNWESCSSMGRTRNRSSASRMRPTVVS